ncbi:MAG: hypothetical protein ACREOG_20325, partial [Gemmatimonadaceae bacterium]
IVLGENMANAYSMDDLLDFLDHAGDRGLMPAATAQALAVASRNVLGVLSDQEKANLDAQDIESVIRRFNNKRARDFNPSSLKEYGRRVTRAIDLYKRWRDDPANFTVKTRATSGARKKDKGQGTGDSSEVPDAHGEALPAPRPGAYQSALPVRPGVVVTLVNIPYDLTKAEAEHLATFVRMLAVDT